MGRRRTHPGHRIARGRPFRCAATLLLLALGGARSAAQTPRLHDPLSEPSLYDLVEATALRTGTAMPFAAAKPWSSRDLAGLLSAIDSASGPGGAGGSTGPAAGWMAELLRREIRLAAGRLEGRAGYAGLEHVVTVAPRADGFLSAGEHELDPPFRPIRPREEEGDPEAAAGAGLLLGYGWLGGGVSAVLDLRGRTDTRNRFDFRDRDEDGAVEARAAYLLWQDPRFLAAAGRLPLEWGSGPLGGLGLSATGPGLDGLLFRVRWPRVQLAILNAVLPDERANRRLGPDGDTIESSFPAPGERPLVDRYFHGHRLDVALGDRFTLGIEEMAIVTGVGRGPELRFLSGLVPYVVAQSSRDEVDAVDVNLGGGVQYRWRLPGRVLLYGEYFANEVFLDDDLREVLAGLAGRRSNTQGFQQGVRWAAPLGWRAVDLEAEIVRTEPFLYLHRGLNTNWRREGVPLGAPLGPDTQRAIVRARLYRPAAGGLLRGTLALTWRERGLRRITDDADVQSSGRPASIPTQPSETSWLGSIGGEMWWPRVGRAGASVTWGRVDNVGNDPGRELHPVDLELYVVLGPAWDHAF